MKVVLEGQQRLLEGLDGIAWVVDASTLRPLFVSTRARDLLGLGGAELIERGGPALRALCERVVAGEDDHTVVHEIDGRWFRTEAHRLGSNRILGLMHDITELKHAEQNLRQRERGLELLLEQLPAAVWTTDRELRILSLRGRGLSRLGMAALSVVGKPLTRVMRSHGQDPDFEPIRLHREALSGKRCVYEISWRGATFHVAVEPFTDEAGHIIGTIGVALDITERKRAEERLEEAQRVAHFGSFEWDVAQNRVSASDELYRILGVSRDEIGVSAEDFLARIDPDDRVIVEREKQQLLVKGGWAEREVRIERPDGARRTLLLRAAAMRDGAESVTRLVGTCVDMTELREVEQERLRWASLVRAALEATTDGILVVDNDGHVSACNKLFLELWQLPHIRNRVVSDDDRELLQPILERLVDPGALLRRIRELHSNREAESADVIEFKDGRLFELHSRPQRLGNQVVGRVWSVRDVTERRRAEQDREQARIAAERALAVRNEFLSIAAHEVRGPITSIQLAIQSLRAGDLSSEQARHVLEIAERQARQISGFVGDLLESARIQRGPLRLELESVDLAQVAREVAARFELMARHARSALSVRAPAPVVGRWDRLRLEQVLGNLVSNGIKFGAGAPVEIDVSGDERTARVSVTDHGIGIPPERQNEIFELFERAVSSRHYGGLGLGLYIVRRVVRALGGEVTVDSEPGRGSRFTVELPRGGP